MYGMSSKDFWEEDPQLYWAYRTFYLQKLKMENERELENLKYNSWLKGSMNYMGTSLALNNAFSKTKREYPSYDKVFEKTTQEKAKKLTKNEVNLKVQEEFNAWARY